MIFDGLINQIGSDDEAPPKEQVKACLESVQMAFKKDTYRIYPSNTDSACELIGRSFRKLHRGWEENYF